MVCKGCRNVWPFQVQSFHFEKYFIDSFVLKPEIRRNVHAPFVLVLPKISIDVRVDDRTTSQIRASEINLQIDELALFPRAITAGQICILSDIALLYRLSLLTEARVYFQLIQVRKDQSSFKSVK